MAKFLHGLGLLLVLGALSWSTGGVQAETITGSAPLGTLTQATLTLTGSGTAQTVLLYEAGPEIEARLLPPESHPPLRVPLPDIPGPVDPQLSATLQVNPTARVEMLIYLAEQADLSAAALITDWDARGAAVVAALQTQANTTQAPLLAELNGAGYVVQPFWIVNAVWVKNGDAALVSRLAGRADIALLTLNQVHQLDPLDYSETQTNFITDAGVAWGVETIQAPRVWQSLGVNGTGVVVATIDTGAVFTHPALVEQYRGNEGNSFEHDYNWFDPTFQYAIPNDLNGHGTHVTGTMVGRPFGASPGVGVAPGAQWIAARGCQTSSCSDVGLIGAAQWILAPTRVDGSQIRPDLRPHIVNNSWGALGASDWYDGYVTAWHAAGIFSVFAAGNYGGIFGCNSTINPGNSSGSFSVGATDSFDYIASFSSRGPGADGLLKPEISAPGVNVLSTWIDGELQTLNGTSMAAPHVAGAVALLWSANPSLVGDIAGTQQALTSTALPLYSSQCGDAPDARPNNVYGWGRLDAFEAVEAVRVDIPWLDLPSAVDMPANGSVDVSITLDARQVIAPGVYSARVLAWQDNILVSHDVVFTVTDNPNAGLFTGQITDLWQATGVYGQVVVTDGPLVWSDSSGHYTLALLQGEHEVRYQAYGYNPRTETVDIIPSTNFDVTLMPDAPHLAVTVPQAISATLAFAEQQTFEVEVQNLGTKPLEIALSAAPHEWRVLVAGEVAPPLYDLSHIEPLALGDDTFTSTPLDLGFDLPIYGGLVRQVYLSSNGWVSLVKPGWSVQFASCLPETRLPPFSIMPFWTDLDPSAGGAVRAGLVDSETYVISFEDVPHWQASNNPHSQYYTFQLVFHASGVIDFIYGDMGPLPGNWAVGFQRNSTHSQQVGCMRESVELNQRYWRFANQPLPAVWLSSNTPTVSVPPGGSEMVEVVLQGFGYQPWFSAPFEGPIWLNTNDPLAKVAAIPTTLTLTGPAPYQVWFPFLPKR